VQGAVQFEPSTVMVMPLTDEVTVIETLPPPLPLAQSLSTEN
jgi:hypothetical protein